MLCICSCEIPRDMSASDPWASGKTCFVLWYKVTQYQSLIPSAGKDDDIRHWRVLGLWTASFAISLRVALLADFSLSVTMKKYLLDIEYLWFIVSWVSINWKINNFRVGQMLVFNIHGPDYFLAFGGLETILFWPHRSEAETAAIRLQLAAPTESPHPQTMVSFS